MAAALAGEQRLFPRMNVNESISSTSSAHYHAHAKEICFNYSQSVQLAALPSPPDPPLVMKKQEVWPRGRAATDFTEVRITIFCLFCPVDPSTRHFRPGRGGAALAVVTVASI